MSPTQSQDKQNIEVDCKEIDFASITYNKSIPKSYNKIDVRELNKNQIEKLTKTLHKATLRGMCKIAAVYKIKIYLKKDAVRVFRGNSKTLKEKTDFCYDLSDKNFYENLWDNSHSIKIDSSMIAILPFSDFNSKIFNSKREARLDNHDLKEIEIILQNKLKNEKVKNLHSYFKQYIATYNSKNQKVIWINFLCSTHGSKWMEERIMIKDKKNCYFNLKINLSNGKIIKFD